MNNCITSRLLIVTSWVKNGLSKLLDGDERLLRDGLLNGSLPLTQNTIRIDNNIMMQTAKSPPMIAEVLKYTEKKDIREHLRGSHSKHDIVSSFCSRDCNIQEISSRIYENCAHYRNVRLT